MQYAEIKKLVAILGVFFSILFPLHAQDTGARVFTMEQYMWYVERYHPVSQQAALYLKRGESTVRRARGAFDPYLFSGMEQKYYNEKEYYSLLNGGLKVPTWFGAELKAGLDRNRGVYLNPENTVPESGLVYAGVSVNAGEGLVIDKRRAALRQAQIFARSASTEQRNLLNDLYFEASKQYWKWVQVWNQYRVYDEAVDLALTRFQAVKQSYLLGDKAAIDTLEAWIQVQNRQVNRNEYLLAYRNATLDLNNYLWFENNTPLVLEADSLRPPAAAEMEMLRLWDADTLQARLGQLAQSHPQLQLYNYKLDILEVERRLKAEALKPKLNLQYNLLNEPVGNEFASNYSLNNYKWGFKFSFPVFMRQERGDLQLSKLKIMETQLQQQQKSLELQNKVRQYYNEQLILDDQIKIYTDAVNNYDNLLKGERQKFDAGESSLFLVNSRETNLINARLKLIELRTKYNIAAQAVWWSAGNLAD